MTLPHTALQFLVLLYFIIVQQAGAAVVFGIIPAEKTPAPGITVSHVHPGTPAHLSGLQAGDTITRINNTHIDTTAPSAKYWQRNHQAALSASITRETASSEPQSPPCSPSPNRPRKKHSMRSLPSYPRNNACNFPRRAHASAFNWHVCRTA